MAEVVFSLSSSSSEVSWIVFALPRTFVMFHKNEHTRSIVNFDGSCINAIDHYVNYDTFRLNFPAHQHKISFPLFGSSLMFFNKGIQLTVCIGLAYFLLDLFLGSLRFLLLLNGVFLK